MKILINKKNNKKDFYLNKVCLVLFIYLFSYFIFNDRLNVLLKCNYFFYSFTN